MLNESCHIKDKGHLPKDPLSAIKSVIIIKFYYLIKYMLYVISSESNLNINYIESNFRKNILEELSEIELSVK